MPGSAQIGNLAVNLSLETAAFTTGALKAKTQADGLKASFGGLGGTMRAFAGDLAKGLGIGLIAGGLAELAKSAFETGSELFDTSQKIGVSVEKLQELNIAAKQSGVSQDSLQAAMGRLNKNLGLLAQGAKPAVDAFAKLGLSAADLKNKTPDEALKIIADRLNALPDVQQRVAVGSSIMGRGFSELLPLINDGSKGIDEYAEKSKKIGEVSTSQAKALHDLANDWDTAKTAIGVFASRFIGTMAELIEKSDDWVTRWNRSRDAFYASVTRLASSAVTAMENMVTGIGQAITGRLGKIWDNAKARIGEITAKFAEMYDKVVGHSYVPDMVDDIAMQFARLGREMVDPTVSATQKVQDAFEGLGSALSRILGTKTGGILASILSLVQAFAPLVGGLLGGGGLGGSKYPVANGVDPLAPLPGMAGGGSGIFGGFGGVDNNLLSLNGSPVARVSKGEHFSVSPTGAGPSRVIVELRDEMLSARIAEGAGQVVVRAAPLIRADTMRAVADQQRRTG